MIQYMVELAVWIAGLFLAGCVIGAVLRLRWRSWRQARAGADPNR